MKTTLLLYIGLIIIGHKLQAQTNVYHPFPDSNAVWRVDQYDECTSGSGDYRLHYIKRYQIVKGDTIINGKKHIKVNEEYKSVCGVPEYFSGNFYLLIENKKISWSYPPNYADKLLYDFSLQKGDTIYTKQALGFKPIVTDIDSILIDGTYRKRWIIDAPGKGIYTAIIEGIGSTNGLIELFFRNQAVHTDLVCFSQNGKTLFPSSSANCELKLGIDNITEQQPVASLCPNPLTSESVLTFAPHAYMQLEVYDLLGRRVYIQPINAEIDTQITLDRSLFASSGLFYYRLLENNGKYTGRGFIVN